MHTFIVLLLFLCIPFFTDAKLPKALGTRKQVVDTTEWIFAKVKIQGFFVGKDRFLRSYSLEPGQMFDEAQHIHSMKAIEQELHGEGYLDAKVTAAKQYDTKNKTVLIKLTLTTGPLFTIEAVETLLKGSFEQEHKMLQERIQAVAQALTHQKALKEEMNATAKKIQKLLLAEGFVHSRIHLTTTRSGKTALRLTYEIALGKVRYHFEGNNFFTHEKLMQELFPSEAQGFLVPEDFLPDEISTLYKNKGFYRIKVHIKKAKSSPTRGVTTAFYINEGPRFKIRQVVLEGSSSALESLIKKALAEVYALTYFDEECIKRALAALSDDLIQGGYWNFHVTKKDPLLKSGADDADLSITITPGEHRIISGIALKGFSELLKESPFREFMQAMPQPLTPETLSSQQRWLVTHFRAKGYLRVGVSHELKLIRRKGLDAFYALIWHVDTKGGPVRFGKTTVSGLYRMKPEIVLRELYYKEGDLWNSTKIEQSLKRLQNLGMLETVSIEQGPGELDRVEEGKQVVSGKRVDEQDSAFYQPVNIRCVEDDPFEIRTRFGVQFVSKSFTHISWSTYKVGGSFVWKNPGGIADQLTFDADVTRFTRNLAASYELPWLGPCPVKTLFSVYSNRFDQPLSTSRQHRLYKEAHDGLYVNFNHLHPWWQSNVTVGFEVNKLFGISAHLAKVIQFEPLLVDKNTPYLYAEPSITVEWLDNKNDPCRGFLSFASLKAMVPPGIKDGAFVRALVEQSLYHPLFFNVIGALRFRFGHIFNARFSTILPTERFYLGGATTLRGYETNMVPPLNDLTCEHTCLWVPVGGKSMVNINAEVRFPLYWLFSGVLFTDMGVLAQDRFADIAANRWLGASGFGLRCCTPIGPLRFDIGWKWHKRNPKDDSYAWFVTLGQAF